jgi:hypothetical protein
MVRTKITKDKVLCNVIKLTQEYKRPVHLADLRSAFNVLEKREALRNKRDGKANRIAKALKRLFDERKISRTEGLVRVEHYPASPYASGPKSVTTNVYFYAPIEWAGKHATFSLNGAKIMQRFVSCEMVDRRRVMTKKEMVFEVLKNSERALTVNEILDAINEKYNAYDVSTKRKYYNATSSLTRAVLKRLRKEGIRGTKKLKHMWVWYLTPEQLEKFKDFYVRKDPVLSLVEDLVKSEKCVPINRILSELQLTPDEARYRIGKVAKYLKVRVKKATTEETAKIDLEINDFRRDSFLDWLGMVVPVPKDKDDRYGYETMLVDLESDWEIALEKQIRKSLSRIKDMVNVGIFYEKLVAKLFNTICTSEELQNSKLSKFMIPFVFRDPRVMNVWVTMESGRRAEFDVLLRGTFNAFNVMADGKQFLDIIIPIESKYTMVKPEHVTAFDDKVRNVFGDGRNVIPIMIGLSWSKEALHLTRRFGILTVYFSAIDKLTRAMTGRKYRHEHEWKRVRQEMKEGRLSFEELKRQLAKQEFKFLFEELIEERLAKGSDS